MYKNELIKAMTNIYAMQLVKWAMEGKIDWVEYCQNFVNKVEDIEENYSKGVTGTYICFHNDFNHETVKWCLGYASANELIKCKLDICTYSDIDNNVYTKNAIVIKKEKDYV